MNFKYFFLEKRASFQNEIFILHLKYSHFNVIIADTNEPQIQRILDIIDDIANKYHTECGPPKDNEIINGHIKHQRIYADIYAKS